MRLLFITTCLMLPGAFSDPTAPPIPVANPFTIECPTAGGVNIEVNSNQKGNLQVIDAKTPTKQDCPQASTAFKIDKDKATLKVGCKSKSRNGYLVEVLDTTQGRSADIVSNEVYWLICEPDSAGDAEPVIKGVDIKPTGIVLPSLQVGFYKDAPLKAFKKGNPAETTWSTLGQDIKMVIYNDKKSGDMNYMIVPTECHAHPVNQASPTLSLLSDTLTATCSTPNTLMNKFTIVKGTTVDLAYTTIKTFKFREHMEKGVEIECKVYLCSDKPTGRADYCNVKNVDQRCINMPTDYITKRRRRDTNVMESSARTSTVRAVLYVKESPLSGVSSARVNLPAALTLCSALISTAMLKYYF